MSRALHPLHEGEFARPVNGDEQIEFPLGRLDLGDVNGEEADRIGLEPLLWLLVGPRYPATARSHGAADSDATTSGSGGGLSAEARKGSRLDLPALLLAFASLWPAQWQSLSG
jgi:hypothetical protein